MKRLLIILAAAVMAVGAMAQVVDSAPRLVCTAELPGSIRPVC